MEANEDNRDAGVKSNLVDLRTSEKMSEVCGLNTHSKTEDDLDSAEDGVNGDAERHPESPPAESESIGTDSDTEEEDSEEDNNKEIMLPFPENSGGRRGGRPLTRCGALTSESPVADHDDTKCHSQLTAEKGEILDIEHLVNGNVMKAYILHFIRQLRFSTITFFNHTE
jgi:hypothetical protein